MGVEKVFINSTTLEKDCWSFAHQIYKSGNDFDLFVGVTRGGAQISIYMHEVFTLLSKKRKMFAPIEACSYNSDNERGYIEMGSSEAINKKAFKNCKILIIDDIFDTGHTLFELKKKVENENPSSVVKTAALYFKPENSLVNYRPDFTYKNFRTEEWVVLPHELTSLSEAELIQKGFPLEYLNG